MLGVLLRVAVAVAIVVVIARIGVRSMRSYVQGDVAERAERTVGPPPTMEVTGNVRLRCPTCGFEVQVLRVPETDGGAFELKPMRHCREEMVPAGDLST